LVGWLISSRGTGIGRAVWGVHVEPRSVHGLCWRVCTWYHSVYVKALGLIPRLFNAPSETVYVMKCSDWGKPVRIAALRSEIRIRDLSRTN